MADRQSGPQDPTSPDEPRSVDTEALFFLKSLLAVVKDHRNVLTSRLPERMEQCLNTETLNPDLAESQPKEESRGDDAERLAERKRSDLERKFDIDRKNKRITALDQAIEDKSSTLEGIKSEQNALISAKDRKTVEKALKKRDKLLEESERKAQRLEEECSKLKKELEEKEKEISETKKVQEERISSVKNESENRVKEMSDKAQDLETQLLKKNDDLQRKYGEFEKALTTHKSSYDAVMNELAAKDKKIQEYNERFSKMKEEVRNAHANVDLYKSRLASVSEKRVKQDQRLVENTLSLNRQSDLERDFSTFFDDDRMDALGIIQSIYQNREDYFVYIYYPRLACIIFETAYEQVKEAKEAATDLFQKLTKIMIDFAPLMGKEYSEARRQPQVWTVPLHIDTRSYGSECSNDVLNGMKLSLKEAAPNYNLDHFVESVLTISYQKWEMWCDEDKSCLFTPASHLMEHLVKYAKACIRLTWRMVTQVPPMKLEFHSSRFSKDVHKNIGYYRSVERRTRNSQPAHHFPGEEIAYYLWPGLQDGGGRLIRAGEVVCKVKVP